MQLFYLVFVGEQDSEVGDMKTVKGSKREHLG